MAVSCYVFAKFNLYTQQNIINNLAEGATTVKCALVDDNYIPRQNRHDSYSAPAWASGATYNEGDLVIPTTANGHLYICTVGGTSGGSEPSWPTIDGETVTDNAVTWECIGNGDIAYYEISGTGYTAGGAEIANKTLELAGADTVLDGDNLLWSSATLTTRYGIIYDDTPSNVDEKKLLAYLDFESNKSASSADFEIQWNADGIFQTTPNTA